MKLSVVIPAYNEEKYIESCLMSLKNQEVPPDEIIVVDNNCTDTTAAICKRYNVTVLPEKKQGMISARNAGFNAAQGDIIARCDADAVLPPDWIKKIKQHFEASSIDALSGPTQFIDLWPHTSFPTLLFIYSMRIFMKRENIMLGPNMALKKTMWNSIKNEVCLEDKLVHEDIDLSLHIRKNNGRVGLDKTNIVYISARRLKKNPLSFFGEYPIRLVKTLLRH